MDRGQNLGVPHKGVRRHRKAITQFNLLSVVCEIKFDPHQPSTIHAEPITGAVKKNVVVNSTKCCREPSNVRATALPESIEAAMLF